MLCQGSQHHCPIKTVLQSKLLDMCKASAMHPAPSCQHAACDLPSYGGSKKNGSRRILDFREKLQPTSIQCLTRNGPPWAVANWCMQIHAGNPAAL
jgi:hypothetical protein